MTSLGFEQTGKPTKEVASWIKWLARMGMFCSAILWILVGVLAVGLAIGAGGETTDRTGALHEIGKQSWGGVLLILLAIGFAGYAIWRFTAAVLGRKIETNEELGWGKRLWYVARGAFYAFLCYTTLAILLGSHSDSSEKEHTEAVLDWSGGRWLVGWSELSAWSSSAGASAAHTAASLEASRTSSTRSGCPRPPGAGRHAPE